MNELADTAAVMSMSRATKLTALAVLATVASSSFLAAYPAYDGVDGTGHAFRATLVEYEGSSALVLLLAPIVVCALPLLVPGRGRLYATWIVAVFAVLFVVAGGFTIGMFYLPTAILLLFAGKAGKDARRRGPERAADSRS